MTTRIAINGFGRIGRMVLRALHETGREDIICVGINDLSDPKALAYLLKYDSVHGRFNANISGNDKAITIDGVDIPCFAQRNPADLPWGKLDVDIVMEATGFFLSQDTAKGHIEAGAKRVLMSAPPKDNTKTVVYGVNHDIITAEDIYVSNASCTTNALAPIVKVLHDNFTITTGFLTTIHAYTGDQSTHDRIHPKALRGRAAALSMVPTTTGAAKAIGRVIPELNDKLDGVAIRVPTPNVSVIDFTANLKTKADKNTINAAFRQGAKDMPSVLNYIEDALVSIDLNHDPHSSTLVAGETYANKEGLIRVMSWYDNEWGFSNRMLDTAAIMGQFL